VNQAGASTCPTPPWGICISSGRAKASIVAFMVMARAADPRPANTVLVVDDDPGFRSALAELLSIDPRLRVVGIAADANEGAAMVRSLRPAVCLCDVRLPGGGGEVVAAEARRSAPETRVVALSAYDDPTPSWGCCVPGRSATS